MSNQEWLSEWASNVKYADTDELYKKIFHEVICVDKPSPCEVKYGQTEDGNHVELSLINEEICSVLLDKR